MVPVEKITPERLQSWGNLLIASHATPVLLLGVGHDHRKGQFEVCVTADIPDEALKGLVTFLYQSVVLRE